MSLWCSVGVSNPTNNLPVRRCLVLGTRTPMDGEEKSGEQRKSPTRAPNPRAFARVSGFQNVFGQGACLNLLITDKLLVCLVLGTTPIEDSNRGLQ